MRTAVHANSLAAFRAEAPTLSRRSEMVLDWVRSHGPATDRQVMDGLGFRDPNAVRPRVTELVLDGLLVEIGTTRCTTTGKTVRLVDVRRGPAQGVLFS